MAEPKKASVKDSQGNKTQDSGAGEREVQAQLDAEVEQGFRGTRTDPTPLENYTVDGVTSGKPTPETDEKAAQRAAQHHADTF